MPADIGSDAPSGSTTSGLLRKLNIPAFSCVFITLGVCWLCSPGLSIAREWGPVEATWTWTGGGEDQEQPEDGRRPPPVDGRGGQSVVQRHGPPLPSVCSVPGTATGADRPHRLPATTATRYLCHEARGGGGVRGMGAPVAPWQGDGSFGTFWGETISVDRPT